MKGKNALIYGATGGLGQAVAKQLLEEEVNVIAIGRSRGKLAALTTALNLDPDSVYCTDSITSASGYQQAESWLKSRNVTLHYCIHAVGQGLMKPAEKLSLDEWRKIIDINLTSAFAFFHLCAGECSPQGYELVYFSSASLDRAWPKNSLYGASKAGLEAFAASLQQEIKTTGGRVWLYRAGSIRTGFFNTVKSHLPLEKMLKPEDVARLVVGNLKTPQGLYCPLIPVLNE